MEEGHAMFTRRGCLIAIVVAALSSAAAAQTAPKQTPPKQIPPKQAAPPPKPVLTPAQRMQSAVAAIMIRSAAQPGSKMTQQLQRTVFTDTELNAWFAADGKPSLPVGLVNPRVTFTGPGSLTMRGTLDLDAVRKSRERGALDPMAYMSGMMEISLVGTVRGSGGQGVFDVETASLGNVNIPKILLQELITFYSKSPDLPDGITLTKPFPLPASVRDIVITRGSATIIQ